MEELFPNSLWKQDIRCRLKGPMEAELWLWEGSMFTKELGEKEEKQQKESCAFQHASGLTSALPSASHSGFG